MDKFTIKHNALSAEEFILLWESVWGQAPSLEQTKLAMEHTLFRVSVFDEDKIVAMARVIGDMGLYEKYGVVCKKRLAVLGKYYFPK